MKVTCFLCNSQKNYECSKTFCAYHRRGNCFLTTDERFAITNEFGVAPSITFDPKENNAELATVCSEIVKGIHERNSDLGYFLPLLQRLDDLTAERETAT